MTESAKWTVVEAKEVVKRIKQAAKMVERTGGYYPVYLPKKADGTSTLLAEIHNGA